MEDRFHQTETEDTKPKAQRSQVREWLPHDLSAIAQMWMCMREKSEWSKWPEIEVTFEELVKWLLTLYADHRYTVFVVETEGVITSCCGVLLEDTHHPPHVKQVLEWILWGDNKRHLAVLWDMAKRWGKKRGAILGQRGTVYKHYQIGKWEKL